MRPGPLLSVGRTSDVFEFGRDAVIKISRPDVPSHWAETEAELTSVVHAFGLPAPAVIDVVSIDGQPCVVFSRIQGPSMWERMVDHPAEIPALIQDMVAVQKMIHAAGLPVGLPDLTARLVSKIVECDRIPESDRREAVDLVARLPSGAAILHGDLHPGNVLMSAAGPVVIDWFDVSIGHPLADVVRSSLLMRADFDLADRQHLPGASWELLDVMHRTYVEAWQEQLTVAAADLRSWEAVIGVARIAEGADADQRPLIALWERRADVARSALLL